MQKKHIIGIIIFISFIILTVLVINGSILALDNFIYQKISYFINPNLTKVMKFITFFGSVYFLVFITIFLFWLFKGDAKGRGIVLFMIASTIINNIIKLLVARPRPNILPLVIEKSYSYPSGHTMASASLVMILLYYLNKEGKRSLKREIPLFLMVLLIMVSRIYLGVHYFSDTIAGFLCSLLLIIIYSLKENQIKK